MSKKRIYISSTYEDLVRHRAAVVRALEAQYDVECMEKYPAFDRRPKEKCLEDVANCEYFVLILGLRYGFEPHEDNPEARSITHLEYDHAVGKKPCFVFLLDPTHRWPAKWVDAHARDSTSKIGRFRNHVALNHGRASFTTPENLATKVLQALGVQEQRERQQTTAAFRWPSPWDFTAYMEERLAGFYGRDWLFSEIDDWLGAGEPRALLIKADFGVGKSAFLAELVRRNPNDMVVAWHFCQHDTNETLHPATFVRSLAARLAQTLPAYREMVESDSALQERLDRVLEDPSSAFEAVVLNPLRKLPSSDAQRVLVIDALDEALELQQDTARSAGTIVSMLAAKAGRLPQWLRILASSRNNRSVIAPLGQAFGLREIDAEDARNQDDLYRYVLARCARKPIAAELGRDGASPESVAALLQEKSGGKFLYAVRALNDLANRTIAVSQLAELPPGMDGFYDGAFHRRFDRAGRDYTTCRELLGVLAVAQEPLSPAMLAAILSRPEAQIKAERAILADFIPLRQGGYALDHFSLSEWLSKEDEEGAPRAGRWAVDLQAAQKRMRDWAIALVESKEAHRQPYLLRHLASHVTAPERASVFAHLLFDPQWLYAKLSAVGLPALIADCAHPAQLEAARLLRVALRNGGHLLAGEPRLLPGQVVGRLAGLDLPELQALCTGFEHTMGEWRPALLPLSASLSLSSALLAILRGHETLVTAIAVLRDGRLAVGSRHGPVRVWTLGSVSEPLVLQGCRLVTALVTLPDGRLASGGDERTVRLWDPSGADEPIVLRGHERTVTALVVLRDGRLATASEDFTVPIWDPSGRAEPIVLRGHESSVNALALLSDGRLASGSNDGTLRVWDPARGAEPLVLTGHDGPVRKLVVLRGGRLASGSDDRTIRVWDCAGPGQTVVLHGHEGAVSVLAALPDGKLASGSRDGPIRVWNLAHLEEPFILEGHKGTIRALAALPDGRLASGADDRTVRVWDPAGSGEPLVLYGHAGLITTLAVLPDGTLASGSGDGTVRLWDLGGRAGRVAAGGDESAFSAFALLADGRLAAGSYDGTVQVRDLTGRVDTVVLHTGKGSIDTIRLLSDGRLACATPNGAVMLWDPDAKSKPVVVRVRENVVGALAVFPDGRFACGAPDNTVRVWHPEGRGQGRVLRGHEDWICALAVLPDGRLVSASDNTVRVWDLIAGGEPQVLRGQDSLVFSLAVLSDGRLAASGDRTVRVWDLANPDGSLELHGHEDLVVALAALPGGRLASGSHDGSVRLWDLSAGREIARFHADAQIRSLVATPDGVIIAGDALGGLHTLRLLD